MRSHDMAALISGAARRVRAGEGGRFGTAGAATGIADILIDEGRRSLQVTLGWIGAPGEVAYGVPFLASNEPSYFTGGELVIDGVLTA